MKRILWFLLLGCLLLTGAYAEGNGEHIQTIQDGVNSVLNGLDFSQTVDMALNVPGWGEYESVEQVVRRIATGEGFSADDVLNMLTGSFAKELQMLSKMMLSIMLPALLVSLLTHTLIPQYDSLLTVSKSVSSVLVLTPIIVMTISELEHTKETIIAMTQRMERMLPMLLTLLTALGGSASSAFLHPMVAAASGSMVFLAREVILRLVMCTCAVTTVNHLSDKAHLTRMVQLLRGAVCWLLGISFTVFLGAMSLQGVTSAIHRRCCNPRGKICGGQFCSGCWRNVFRHDGYPCRLHAYCQKCVGSCDGKRVAIRIGSADG